MVINLCCGTRTAANKTFLFIILQKICTLLATLHKSENLLIILEKQKFCCFDIRKIQVKKFYVLLIVLKC